MNKPPLHLHLVSDSTGETVHQIARACLAQFPNVRTTEHIWTLVRSERHVEAVIKGVDRNPGIMLMSIVDPEVRRTLESHCKANNCLLYTSPSPRDISGSRMPSSA